MTRNRFFELKSFLYAAGNHSFSDSWIRKDEPLCNLLKQKLQPYGILHEDLSIDESMVQYYGRNSWKQFIRVKPIRYGYKFCVLASATGLRYNVKIYAEKYEMILVSHLELVWRRMYWMFVNAEVITVYTLIIFSQATNCS